MAFYGDSTKAASLAGVNVTDITTEMQDVINNWIKANIKWNGFEESSDVIEYYDIKKSNQDEIILNNFPVISVSEIVDNVHSDAPQTLDSDSYVVDNNTGIIQLIKKANTIPIINGCLNFFSKGFNSVKVTYKYGYATVPDIIAQIATLMIAKWAKIKDTQADADGTNLKSVRIGDYSETYDLTFMNIKSEFDDILIPMIKRAQEYYADGV